MAEEEGFEPPHQFPDLPVFKTGPFNHLGIPPTIMVDPVGLEPTTDRLWAGSSNHWAKGPSLVAAGGLEPSTYRVWAGRSNQLGYTAILR